MAEEHFDGPVGDWAKDRAGGEEGDDEFSPASATDALTLAGLEFRVLSRLEAPHRRPRLLSPVRYRLDLQVMGEPPLQRLLEVDSRTYLNELIEMIAIVFELPQCESVQVLYNGAQITTEEPMEGIPLAWHIRIDELLQLPLSFAIRRGPWHCQILMAEKIPADPIIAAPSLIGAEGPPPPLGCSDPGEYAELVAGHSNALAAPATEAIHALLESYAPRRDVSWLRDEALKILNNTPFRREIAQCLDALSPSQNLDGIEDKVARPWMVLLDAVRAGRSIPGLAHHLIDEFGCHPPRAADVINTARVLGLITVDPSGAELTELGAVVADHPRAFLNHVSRRGVLEANRFARTHAYLCLMSVAAPVMVDSISWRKRQLDGLGILDESAEDIMRTSCFLLAASMTNPTDRHAPMAALATLLLADPDSPVLRGRW
ncbi:MAG: hypothetical protein Q4P33_04350 [Flaviflexus sp.]|nr:hypothetical protein [Flaviflexus sp.]